LNTPTATTLQKRQLWLTATIVLLALWIARPFVSAIAWAAVLAIAEWPFFLRMTERQTKRPFLFAIGFTIATGLFVILPLSLVATSLAAESQGALDWMQQTQATGLAPPAWFQHMPIVGGRLTDWWRTHIGSSNAVKEFLGTINAGWALGWARVIAGEVARESGLFLITLLALVSFLARGDIIAVQARLVAKRIFGRFGEDFLARLTEAVRRTVAGTLLVSVAEGSIIGIGYVVAGVPQPLLFTVVTILLALVPFGAWAVFGLAGLILIGQDHLVAGVAVMAYGATIMTLGDNLVQPAVIGGAMRLPFLLALVGTFGGIAAMGLVGLFIGPVIMVALLLIWREWATNMAGDEPPK
jgi:predicted PurR-regulated permease PerM